jgi:class 3 adenylate cyclase/pimeloyl-ACP methyl ester carboxylesterase
MSQAPIPSVQYAKRGDFTLAYQVLGEGEKNLVYLPPETPNVVGNWFVPEHARFMERLASFSRLVITDRRGLGCSDRMPPGQAPTLEEHVDDLLEVMQVAYAAPAVVFAGAETAFIAMLAAAAHPDRFHGMILWGASPSWRQSDDLPWEEGEDATEANLGSIRRVTNLRAWAERFTRITLPSWADNPERVALVEALSALGGSAEAWYQDQRVFHGVDLRDLLPSIHVPTLVLARPASRQNQVRSARFLAEHLPNASLVELEGADGLPFVGDADAVLDEIERFVVGSRPAGDPRRALATVLFTDIVDSTKRAVDLGDAAWAALLQRHNAIAREELGRFGGLEIDTTGDGFFATFDGPARAVSCARSMTARVQELGLAIRAGIHTGEIERAGNQRHGVAVHVGARVAALAGPSEILVTSTVKDLTAGAGLVFADAGEHALKGVPEPWHLYRLIEGDADRG